jgi:hypothetical protein
MTRFMVYPISPEYRVIDIWKRFMSRDIAISIVPRLWVGQRSNRGSTPGRIKKIFSSLKSPSSLLLKRPSGQSMKLTTQLHLASRWKMSSATTPSRLPSWGTHRIICFLLRSVTCRTIYPLSRMSAWRQQGQYNLKSTLKIANRLFPHST